MIIYSYIKQNKNRSYQMKEQQKISCDEIEELQNDFIHDVAEFFKVFGDSTRIKLLRLLLEQELCVGEIAEKLNMNQSAVSHQLRVLRQNDLVKYRKEGKTVFYSLDDDHIKVVLEQGMRHICHKKGYVE